jgi:hypothetical protein
LNERRTLRSFEIQQVTSLLDLLNSIQLCQTKKDVKVWNLTKDGTLTVKSCHLLLDRIYCSGVKPFQCNVWIKIVPPKIQCFIWLAVQEGICTGSFLLKHQVLTAAQALCPLCSSAVEKIDHMLIHCSFVLRLWCKIKYFA